MAFNYGFYSSLNGDRKYTAKQFSELFNGIINDGIFMNIGDKMMVKVQTGMTLLIGSGRAWFDSTWTSNTTDYPITIEARDVLDRIDTVVLEVDETHSVRQNSFKIIKGTPASSPVAPTLTNDDNIHQHALAEIYVQNRTTNSGDLTNADITNKVGTDDTPFITGILQTVSAQTLLTQWETEFKNWENEQKASFSNWRSGEETSFETWETEHKNAFSDWETTQKNEFESWESDQESSYATWSQDRRDAFDEWFANISYVLSGDAAGKLQVEIDNISPEVGTMTV